MVKVRLHEPSHYSRPVLPAKATTAFGPPLLLHAASSSSSFSDSSSSSSLFSPPKESQPWLAAYDRLKNSLAFFSGMARLLTLQEAYSAFGPTDQDMEHLEPIRL